jgi:hypothetical protein
VDKDYILEKLEGRYTVNEETGCWIWNGTTEENKKYYPQLRINGANYYAHKLIARVYNNEGSTIKHSCKNKRCVNPDHLKAAIKSYEVTSLEMDKAIITYMKDSKTTNRDKAIADLLSFGINYYYYVKEKV